MMENILPELEPSEVEEVVQIFKDVFQPAVKILKVFVRNHPENCSKIITVEGTQRSLERSDLCRIQRTMISDEHFTTLLNVNTVDITPWVYNAFSKSEKLKAVMHVGSSEEADKKKKYYLEIWSEEKLMMTFDLTSLDLHGSVYTDILFGSFNWSYQEDKIVYVAEKKQPKAVPFYEQKITKELEDDKKPLVGKQFIYEDDWGEQMTSKINPVIAVCDISKKTIEILNGVPDGISPGQVVWDPNGDGVVGVGISHKPRRLGIIFCSNRPSYIFHLSLEGKYSVLSDPLMSACSPQFSPNGKYLVWFQRKVGGPHCSASTLVKYNWSTKEITVIVDIIDDVVLTKNGREFFGIYCSRLEERCWTSNSEYVLLSTFQKQRINVYAINIDNGSIVDIGSTNEDESISLLDVTPDDFAICAISSLTHPPSLVSIFIPEVVNNITDRPKWNSLTESAAADSNIFSRFTVPDPKTKKIRCYAMYYGPKDKPVQSVPLILYPHGGPHGNSPSVFSPTFCFFARLGFGILIVNYNGSVGYGKNFVDSLLGEIGSLDVEDCYLALQNCLEKFPWLDPKNVFVFGGSHGGFLATHLSSNYPNDFKAIAAINPVTNLPAMLYTTDIPDWNLVESGFTYEGIANVMCNDEIWKKMADVSPMYNVSKVKAPTLLLLGKNDQRVPHSQGLSYYNALKELNVPTRVLLYDDNHSLSSVRAEMDAIINSALWFKKSMKYSVEF